MNNVRTILLFALVASLVAMGAWAQDATQITHDGPVGPPGGGAGDCTGLTDYAQPIDVANFNTARTSDAESVGGGTPNVTSEGIVSGAVITPLTGGTADALRFWGLSLEFNNGFVAACAADNTANTPFNIVFSADAGGAPGAVIATTTGTPTSIVDTGVPFAFTTIFRWDVTIPATDVTGAAWVTIQRQEGVDAPNGNSCLFLWLDEINAATYDNVAHQNGASVPSDHVFCLNAPIAVDSDIELTKTGEEVGGQIVYTLTVTNNGPDDASNVVVTDVLPPEVTYNSDDCGGSDVPPFTWNVGALANGATAVCNVTVDINPGVNGDIVNSASASSDQMDPVPANNDSSATVRVGSVLEIPTLGQIGLGLLLLLLAGAGIVFMRRS
ncbi:MAG: DUF11 domain-containing protein [Acidobacteriota bacterium]